MAEPPAAPPTAADTSAIPPPIADAARLTGKTTAPSIPPPAIAIDFQVNLNQNFFFSLSR